MSDELRQCKYCSRILERYSGYYFQISSMSSLINGYEYDVFISYRQKDNKYDGWVTEFAENLRKELEATFKDEVSIYFDINPYDGLLETYNVDASLREKLKCLVFIPIISQTYCDTRSFAWQNEFIKFNKMAQEDSFGRDIKLNNGNIASRILPVKIHDLDNEDIALLENELGGVFRSVDFIFKSPGVNRPLKHDDNRNDNLNRTYYRDQINKVANAVKEIINSLKNQKADPGKGLSDRAVKSDIIRTKKFTLKTAFGMLILTGLIATGYFVFSPSPEKGSEMIEKSIVVLPFFCAGNDPDLEFVSYIITQEIQFNLFKIGGLRIPSSNSNNNFKNPQEEARKLNVSYILEGSISKSGDKLFLFVKLVNGKNGELIWMNEYNPSNSFIDLHDIQSEVTKMVAKNMNVVINPEAKKNIEKLPTDNDEAYLLYNQVLKQIIPFDNSIPKLKKAILLDPEYADAYGLLASCWLYKGVLDISRDSAIQSAEPLIKKSLQLDENSFQGHLSKAILSLFYYWDFESVDLEFQFCHQLMPSYSNVESFFADYLLVTEKYDQAFAYSKKAYDNNKESEINWIEMALAYYFNNENENSYDKIQQAKEIFPENFLVVTNFIRLSVYMKKYDMALEEFEKENIDMDPDKLSPIRLGYAGIAYFASGNKNKSSEFLNELLRRGEKSDIGSPLFFAAEIYTSKKDYDKAIL